MTTVASARAFVSSAELPAVLPSVLADGDAVAMPDFAFDTAKEQAAVVGSDVISFITGITPEQRSDLVNATLLAQLVAKKKHPLPQDIKGVIAWYDGTSTCCRRSDSSSRSRASRNTRSGPTPSRRMKPSSTWSRWRSRARPARWRW